MFKKTIDFVKKLGIMQVAGVRVSEEGSCYLRYYDAMRVEIIMSLTPNYI